MPGDPVVGAAIPVRAQRPEPGGEGVIVEVVDQIPELGRAQCLGVPCEELDCRLWVVLDLLGEGDRGVASAAGVAVPGQSGGDRVGYPRFGRGRQEMVGVVELADQPPAGVQGRAPRLVAGLHRGGEPMAVVVLEQGVEKEIAFDAAVPGLRLVGGSGCPAGIASGGLHGAVGGSGGPGRLGGRVDHGLQVGRDLVDVARAGDRRVAGPAGGQHAGQATPGDDRDRVQHLVVGRELGERCAAVRHELPPVVARRPTRLEVRRMVILPVPVSIWHHRPPIRAARASSTAA